MNGGREGKSCLKTSDSELGWEWFDDEFFGGVSAARRLSMASDLTHVGTTASTISLSSKVNDNHKQEQKTRGLFLASIPIPIEEKLEETRKLPKTRQILPPYYPPPREKKQNVKLILAGSLVLVVGLIGAVLGVLKIRRYPNHRDNNVSILVTPTPAPKPQVSSIPCPENLPDMYISCVCNGSPSFDLPEYIQTTTERLKTIFVPEYLPETVFEHHPTSCRPANVALVWLTDDLNNGDHDYSFEEIRERFLVANLFVARKGHAWTESANWLSAAHVCGWYGIKCKENSVVAIEMPDNSLVRAPLPSELFLLTNLKLLELGNNSITGVFPSEMFGLTDLVYVDMERNLVTGGTIGSELGQLSELRSLKLNDAGKGLAYSLSTEIAQLVNLEELRLANCAGVGTIPSEMAALSNALEEIDLSGGGGINGAIPSELGLLTELRYLKLGDNDLDSTVPTQLGELRHLEKLDLGKNGLIHGTLPVELGQLVFLKHVRLRETGLTGSLPSALAMLERMKCFDIGGNPKLLGATPETWCATNSTQVNVPCGEVLECSCCTCDANTDPC